MHRFFVESPIGNAEEVTLSREESAHAARVLRLRAGEEVRLLDGQNLYAAELIHVHENGVTAKITGLLPSPEAGVRITLIQGLPKADKPEMIAQKATELGAWELWFVQTERSVAKAEDGAKGEKKRERLRRIALEAAKQSGRAHVPEIAQTLSFRGLCKRLEEKQAGQEPFDAVFVAWEEEQAVRLSEAVTAHQGGLGSVAVVIGPEGGLSAVECKALEDTGARCVTLGKRILRTETAGLCAIAVILTALGEM